MKKTVRKLSGCVLAAVLLVSLAACAAPQSARSDAAAEPAAQPLAAQSSERVLSGEMAYISEYLPLSANEQEHISPRAYTDEGFYTVEFEKVSDDIPEGAVESYEGEFDVYETYLSFTGFDGSVRRLEKFEGIGAPENTQGLADFSSGFGLENLTIAPDGSIYLIETAYYSWYDGPAGLTELDADYWNYQQYANEFYLRRIDRDGAELSRAVLPVAGEYVYTHSAACDSAGNLLLLSDGGVRIYSVDGQELGRISCESYPDSIVRLADGRCALSYWGDNGFNVAVLDTVNMGLSPLYTLPGGAYALTGGAGAYDLFYTNGGAFYGVSKADGSHEKLFDWINCDIIASNITSVKAMDDGSFVTVSNEYRNIGDDDYVYEVGIVTIRNIPVEDVPVRKELSFATAYLDQEASDMIVDFNRSNPHYRIVVKDYFDYNSDGDMSRGPARLIEDLASGQGADIIDLDSLPYEVLASRGLLEDLYPYIDRDELLSRADFFPSVLSALEVDGKLFSTVGSFSINTLLAAENAVAYTDGWTYAQLYENLAAMPEGCQVFDAYTTAGGVLRDFMTFELDGCIDWKTGECDFGNESFLALLDFASHFPREFDWTNYVWEESDSSEYRMSRGLQLLSRGAVHGFDDINYNTAFFGSDVNYVGYPSHDGQFRSSLVTTHRFAMNASSSNKDVAWEFLRGFMCAEQQGRNIWNFPARIDLYEQRQAIAMEVDYLNDEQGEPVLDENNAPIVMPKGKMGGIQGTVIDVYPLTQTQADKLLKLVNSSDVLSNISAGEALENIVTEEAARFFSGELSAAEAAENMNLKVSEYLSQYYR